VCARACVNQSLSLSLSFSLSLSTIQTSTHHTDIIPVCFNHHDGAVRLHSPSSSSAYLASVRTSTKGLLFQLEGVLYGTELGSVTLKRIGFFCFPI